MSIAWWHRFSAPTGALGVAAEAGWLLDDARAPGWTRLHASLSAVASGGDVEETTQAPGGESAGPSPVAASREAKDQGQDGAGRCRFASPVAVGGAGKRCRRCW